MHLPSARPEERTIYAFSISWWYTLAQVVLAALIPVIFAVLTMGAWQAGIISLDNLAAAQGIAVIAGFSVALVPLASALYLRLARHYFITTERVIAVTGWLAQETVSIDYPAITDLTVGRDIFERFVTQSGSLSVDTAGGPGEEITFIHIANPIGVRDQILELVGKAKKFLARTGDHDTAHPLTVAPSSATVPIATDPTVVDANNNGRLDAEESAPSPDPQPPSAPTNGGGNQ